MIRQRWVTIEETVNFAYEVETRGFSVTWTGWKLKVSETTSSLSYLWLKLLSSVSSLFSRDSLQFSSLERTATAAVASSSSLSSLSILSSYLLLSLYSEKKSHFFHRQRTTTPSLGPDSRQTFKPVSEAQGIKPRKGITEREYLWSRQEILGEREKERLNSEAGTVSLWDKDLFKLLFVSPSIFSQFCHMYEKEEEEW